MEKQLTKSILISKGASRFRRLVSILTEGFLFIITSVSTIAVIFIIIYIARDAIPFFRLEGIKEFFTSISWYPSKETPEFGALAIIYGSLMVTFTAIIIAVPLAIFSAVSLSDILPFSVRQIVKPIIEIISAIPSVAFGFFALVIFAPMLQKSGGHLLSITVWIIGLPLSFLLVYVIRDLLSERLFKKSGPLYRWIIILVLEGLIVFGLYKISSSLAKISIASGTNALNVSIILAIMALPTIVSVSEDALQAAGRELREGSYALGATRSETIMKVVIPAAKSGIVAAIILGVMRTIGETMVVWMASGNASQIPKPWFNVLKPIRTLTATIAGDMGEADQVTGSSRYHVLFAMALLLLIISFVTNLISEYFVSKSRKKWGR